jgi:hypothetical protein
MKIEFKYLLSAIVFILLFACNKHNEYSIITPPAQASFANTSSGTYYIKNDPNSIFKIPVGTTTLSSIGRNIAISVASPTGAASGTQYTLPANSVTIPAGKALDSFAVKGLFSGFTGTRVDTLVLTISGGDVPVSSYNSTYKLVMRKYCDVVSSNLTGDYTNTLDYYPASLTTGSPSASKYTATISNWTAVTATTATVKILNLGLSPDNGFGPFAATDPAATGLTATVDWTDPANFKLTLSSQPYMASLYSYGAATISGSGVWSACDQTFTITYTVKVSLGSFSPILTKLVR